MDKEERAMRALEMLALKSYVYGFFMHLGMFGDFIYARKSSLDMSESEVEGFKSLLDDVAEGDGSLKARLDGFLKEANLEHQFGAVCKFHETLYPYFDLPPKDLLKSDIEMKVSFLSGYLDGMFLALPLTGGSR